MPKFKYFLINFMILIIGIIGTLVVSKKYLYNDITNQSQKIKIVDSDSINSSISLVYDSVYLIAGYKDNQLISTGTGFVYKKDDKNGYILTNHHVIENGTSYKVIDINNNALESTLLGSDEYTDLAVLSINSNSVKQVVKTGDSNNNKVGDTVFTVGSPLGSKYLGTVTKGILSGKNRQLTVSMTNGDYVMDVLQTDAAINPGNSGGPLVNLTGEVIGITSMKLIEDEIEGMGFALPIETAMSYVERLEKNEKIVRPLLGVQVSDVSNDYIYKQYGIELSDTVTKGVVVLKVEDNSPAKEVDLKIGDVIVKIDDEKITNNAYFRYSLYKHELGNTIKITYIRNNEEKTCKAKLTKSL